MSCSFKASAVYARRYRGLARRSCARCSSRSVACATVVHAPLARRRARAPMRGRSSVSGALGCVPPRRRRSAPAARRAATGSGRPPGTRSSTEDVRPGTSDEETPSATKQRARRSPARSDASRSRAAADSREALSAPRSVDVVGIDAGRRSSGCAGATAAAARRCSRRPSASSAPWRDPAIRGVGRCRVPVRRSRSASASISLEPVRHAPEESLAARWSAPGTPRARRAPRSRARSGPAADRARGRRPSNVASSATIARLRTVQHSGSSSSRLRSRRCAAGRRRRWH